MTYRPGNATRTRDLMTTLATTPEPATAPWAADLTDLTREVRDTLHSTDPDDPAAALPFDVLLRWRNEFDRTLGALERDQPALWARTRTPGSWLDALLRLRSILTHVVSKAYWSGHQHVALSSIETERYLWGAR